MTLKAAFAANKAEAAMTKVGEALDDFLALARHDVRPDQLRVLQGTASKLLRTYERCALQLGALFAQYDKFANKPPPPAAPRAPATVHRLDPTRKPRRRR